MTYIAHIRQQDGAIQTVQDHLIEVQQGAERVGEKIGVKYLAGIAGLLHDLGKNTDQFRDYIQDAVANPDAPPRKGSVDHSTAGGRLLHRRYHHKAASAEVKSTVEWIANCIISHHQGLRDYVSPEKTSPYIERVVTKQLDQYEQAEEEFFKHNSPEQLDEMFKQATDELQQYIQIIKKHKLPPIAGSLLIKYIFSCLIDADRTNTRRFEENEPQAAKVDDSSFFQKSYELLSQHLTNLKKGSTANTPINQLRREMSRQCEEFAFRPSGVYTLSIPTGGGKTLASMRYALRHAIEYNKQRIIYIVPYTTIIEQNAAEIRNILRADDMILEHHSNVVDDKDDERQDGDEGETYDQRKKNLKLARDHWDRPIIFTTMVQFLNTFYAKGTRNVRRLHQLSNAVIVFDEVQSVPVKCISLFNASLNFLHVVGRSSLLLCTATQPALDFVKHKLHFSVEPEIIQNLEHVEQSFKRVELHDRTQDSPSGWGAEELSSFVQEQMREVDSVLVILNTKTAVRKLFEQLNAAEWLQDSGAQVVHLSTNMCAAHRKEMLSGENGVIQRLAKGERIICVSTQLIEAGVNISFECVVRSLAGLDSIAQAAGRCNRHGKDEIRNVYIIKSSDEVLTHLPEIKTGAAKTERVLQQFQDDPESLGYDLLSAKAMTCYFQYYFNDIADQMHYPIPKLEQNLFDLMDRNRYYVDAYRKRHDQKLEVVNQSAIATAEKYFEAISTNATPVIVPYGEEGNELIMDLNGKLEPGEMGELLRKAQQYTVNIYDHELRALEKNGDVYPLLHGHALALREPAYSDDFGVEAKGEGAWEKAII
ncbi:CRISPR-associated helicase/endonuclease Cas3 [Paenibacillus xylanivorans]|uniref:CRISPR-associated protein Cas3 n=1 Tax=Paenibacillus xylanivorans TaxID=1705561 RepID=A0A0M9BJ43_9BACL|nr:CRISPR-associated helicase/endonuclease Cas3 [Paenibacillus xylanivorans]KOY12999.1 CRISPR-associated protein Cas3 [Paenibacillus xylanivorans]